jgi:hypothetical protein
MGIAPNPKSVVLVVVLEHVVLLLLMIRVLLLDIEIQLVWIRLLLMLLLKLLLLLLTVQPLLILRSFLVMIVIDVLIIPFVRMIQLQVNVHGMVITNHVWIIVNNQNLHLSTALVIIKPLVNVFKILMKSAAGVKQTVLFILPMVPNLSFRVGAVHFLSLTSVPEALQLVDSLVVSVLSLLTDVVRLLLIPVSGIHLNTLPIQHSRNISVILILAP